ncbi:MAG: prepilin-type N-terminal cleavage/methylation domain-containing protein [Pseudomonadota bacterium]
MSSAEFYPARPQQGFSLIEMAIVLVILGMLLGGLMMPLASQREVSQRQAAERQLQEIRNALIGFAQANNRLPCPAALGSDGVEARVPLAPASATAGNCIAPLVNNYVPYQILGIQGTIIGRNLVDVWQQPIRYRLAANVGPLPTSTLWIYAKSPIPTTLQVGPYFQICPAAGACPTADATNVVAVIFSTGRDGADIPLSTSPDQIQNRLGTTNNFIMRTPTEYHRTGIEFDDIVVWISQPTLIYELSRAGQ